MLHYPLFYIVLPVLLLGFVSCSDQPSAAEISKYEQTLADWNTNFACLDEAAMTIDQLYDQWDAFYQVLPQIFEDLPAAAEQSFEEVEKTIQDCRDVFYQSLSELRITDNIRTEFAADIRTIQELQESKEWTRLDMSRYQEIETMVEQLTLTCERYTQEPVENTAECQQLLNEYLQAIQ
jgi:hypothetical protein